MEICYVVANCDKLILSREACGKLIMLGENFPKGEVENNEVGVWQTNRGSDLVKTRPAPIPAKVCGCPERRVATSHGQPRGSNDEVNREKLEHLIKDYYKHSSFNVCPHYELPVMTGDPLRIVVDPRVKPYAVHKAIPVPLHWRDTVLEHLARYANPFNIPYKFHTF